MVGEAGAVTPGSRTGFRIPRSGGLAERAAACRGMGAKYTACGMHSSSFSCARCAATGDFQLSSRRGWRLAGCPAGRFATRVPPLPWSDTAPQRPDG